MLDHFADFSVSNLPSCEASMFQQVDVVVKRTKQVVHVSKMIRQRQFVSQFVSLAHRSSFEERFI